MRTDFTRAFRVPGPISPLFRRPTGELYNRNSAGAQWRMIRRDAGLPDKVTLHTQRHTYASNLIAEKCDVVTVQRRSGTLSRASH